jgi:tripartite-type tricarboxylate transporter receptor subunit TctC
MIGYLHETLGRFAARGAVVGLALALGTGAGLAQTWPSQPITLVVPYAAGGAGDTMGRLFAEAMAANLATPVVVENRTGAGGAIGANFVARAAADGYTLGVAGNPSHVVAPNMRNVDYDPLGDFSHIAYFGGPPLIIAVHPSLGINTLAELIELARSQERLPYVSAGLGTVSNLAVEYVNSATSANFEHIAYAGGAEAVTDLLAGHVKVGSLSISTARGHIEAGNLIPLAISTSERLPFLPDLPTLAELGYPELVVATWFSLAAPAGTPADVVARLSQAALAAAESPRLVEYTQREGIELLTMTPEEMTAYMAQEIEKWSPIIRAIRPE